MFFMIWQNVKLHNSSPNFIRNSQRSYKKPQIYRVLKKVDISSVMSAVFDLAS